METNEAAVEPAEEREVVITRVFKAPARLLFEAYSNPEHVKRWFGPRGWPLTRCEMDFRVGGHFRFEMTGPNGESSGIFGGQYLEIEPYRKIVYDNGFEAPGAERMIVTYTYDEHDDGTTTFTMRTLFGSIAMKNLHVGMGHIEGTNSGLDQLEELAAELQAHATA